MPARFDARWALIVGGIAALIAGIGVIGRQAIQEIP